MRPFSGGMEKDRPWKRPPVVDADYRVVRGPWPRWALHLGLLKLALRTALVVIVLIGLALAGIWAARGLL
jgi:hypothetical protein